MLPEGAQCEQRDDDAGNQQNQRHDDASGSHTAGPESSANSDGFDRARRYKATQRAASSEKTQRKKSNIVRVRLCRAFLRNANACVHGWRSPRRTPYNAAAWRVTSVSPPSSASQSRSPNRYRADWIFGCRFPARASAHPCRGETSRAHLNPSSASRPWSHRR